MFSLKTDFPYNSCTCFMKYLVTASGRLIVLSVEGKSHIFLYYLMCFNSNDMFRTEYIPGAHKKNTVEFQKASRVQYKLKILARSSLNHRILTDSFSVSSYNCLMFSFF